MKKHLPLISLIAMCIYAVLIQYLWGWKQVFATWQEIGFDVFFFGMGLILLTHLVRGWRMFHFFSTPSMRFAPLFYLSQTHNLLNNLLPFRSGEVSFPLLMKNQFGTPLMQSTAGLLWLRFLDAHTLGLLALFVLMQKYQMPWMLMILLWLLAFVIPVVIFYLHQPIHNHLATLTVKIKPSNKPLTIFIKIMGVVQKLLASLPKTQSLFFSTWLLTWLNWVIKIVLMGIIVAIFLNTQPFDFMQTFNPFNSQASLLLAGLAGAVTGEITSILPINAPAGVGTYAGGVYVGVHWFAPHLKNAMFAGINLHLLIMLSAFFGVIFASLLKRLTDKHQTDSP